MPNDPSRDRPGAPPPHTDPDPSVFVVFGATGDLAKRKIIPALYQLHIQGFTKRGLVVLGVTRDDNIKDEEFRDITIDAVRAANPKCDENAVREWATKFVFFQD